MFQPAAVSAGVINLLQMSRSLSPCILVAPDTCCGFVCALLLRTKPLILLHGNDHHNAASVLLDAHWFRSEEHTSELQSLMRISYAVFCLKKKTTTNIILNNYHNINTIT